MATPSRSWLQMFLGLCFAFAFLFLFFFKIVDCFIYLIVVVLGLHCGTRALQFSTQLL